jgi:L-asparaginase
MTDNKTKVLLIYTGGTIGMIQDAKTQALIPFNFKHLSEQVPELQKFDLDLSSYSFEPPMDSSDMRPDVWIKIAALIEENYNKVDGFVILHGSDTMAYTASALSFLLDGLSKPVILTGSQLPIGIIRTDGKENLITAIEIAAAKENNRPVVTEVAIYFEYKLYRGNRTHKFNAEHFDAFKSYNYPELAEAGVTIKYNHNALLKPGGNNLSISNSMDCNIAIIKIFPGIIPAVIESITRIPGLKAIILETFGSGNATTEQWFLDLLKEAIDKDIIIFNVTQCNGGSVVQGKYETSKGLRRIGVVSGADITTEAAVTKLMYLLGKKLNTTDTKRMLQESMRGELTPQPI